MVSRNQVDQVLRAYIGKTGQSHPTGGTASKGSSEKPKGGDRVDLSMDAQELKRYVNAIARVPEARTEKVEQISAKVNSGEYYVDATDIAEKMLGRVVVDEMI